MGKRFDKEFKIEAVRLASEPGNTQSKSNAILASARALSADGNVSCAKTATRRFQAKAASNRTTMTCGVSSVKMNAFAGSVTS
jgi:hypothetical protein